MKTFVHPFAVKITEESVVLNKAFPLVRELAHKYGLSVIAKKEAAVQPEYDVLYMAREDGIPVCRVFFMQDKESFAIRNCINSKDRGRSYDDKLTYFGKKVSFVMKTVEKEHLIPTDTRQFINNVFRNQIENGINSFSESYGEIRKSSHGFGGDVIHHLIDIVLGNRHVSTLSAESMSNIQSALDKYRETDKTREERKRELAEVFSAPMWAIIYDKTDSFCIGKLNLIPKWKNDMHHTSVDDLTIEIAEPFKRVADITDVPELIPTMTMLKVAIQQNNSIREKQFVGESEFFPDEFERVITELRVIGTRGGSRWERKALLSPKLLLVAA
jgi:uncharacterized protein YkuJ